MRKEAVIRSQIEQIDDPNPQTWNPALIQAEMLLDIREALLTISKDIRDLKLLVKSRTS